MGTVTRERGRGRQRGEEGGGAGGDQLGRGLGLWNQVLPEGWSRLRPAGSVHGRRLPCSELPAMWAIPVRPLSKLFPSSPPCYGASCHLKSVQRSINGAGVATVHVSMEYYPKE